MLEYPNDHEPKKKSYPVKKSRKKGFLGSLLEEKLIIKDKSEINQELEKHPAEPLYRAPVSSRRSTLDRPAPKPAPAALFYSAEEIFFRYSYPLADELLYLGKLSAPERNKIESLLSLISRNSAASRSSVTSRNPAALQNLSEGLYPKDQLREFLKTVFSDEFAAMSELASQTGTDCWSSGLVRKYFLMEHNNNVTRREGIYGSEHYSNKLLDLCRIRPCIVTGITSKNGSTIYETTDGKNTYAAMDLYLNHCNIGDIILVHLSFAIETLNARVLVEHGIPAPEFAKPDKPKKLYVPS